MPDQKASLPERVQLLSEQVQHLEQVLAQVRDKVSALQTELQNPPAADAAAETKPAQPASLPQPAVPSPEITAAPPWPFQTAPRKSSREWEAIIGGNWFNKIGIGAIILGMAFFLRYALENEWIGNRGKVWLGIIAGLLLLAGGGRYHCRRLKMFARGLTGGGAAILYLSLYFAFQIYQIISQPVAFILMALVTAVTAALSLRYNSRTVLLFAMFGGFFTPFWVSTGLLQPFALFTYTAILDLGLLALAWRKEWKFVNTLCFFATAALYSGWFANYYTAEQFWLAEAFLIIFYLIFAALAFLIHLMRKQRAQSFDAFSIAGNALFLFVGNLKLLDSIGAQDYRGLFTAALAILYGLFSFIAWRRHAEDKLLTFLLLGAAVTFLTLFFPIELHEDWLPLAWLMETLVLINAGAYLRLAALQRMGLVLGLLSWLALFGYISDRGGLPIEAGESVTFLFGVIGIIAALIWQPRKNENVSPEFARWLMLWEIITLLTLPFLLATFWTSLALLAIAAILLIIPRLPFTSSPLLPVSTFVPLATFAVFLREYDPDWITLLNYSPILNSRFLSYLAGAVLLGWFLYADKNRKRGNAAPTLDSWLLKFAQVQALALPFFALTLEVINFYGFREQAANFAVSMHAPKHLTLSAVWSIFSLMLLIAGIWQRLIFLRLAALLIFALTILKVAFIDFWLFEKIYRIISALAFGAIMVYASYLYQRHKDKIIAAVMGNEQEKNAAGNSGN